MLADKLLAEAQELGLTGRQIKELGDEEMGNPKRRVPDKTLQVSLPGWVYKGLKARAKGHNLGFFITNIIGGWLDGTLWAAPPPQEG